MRPERLLFILPNLLGGGAERVTLTLLRELAGRGYQVSLYLFKQEGVFWPEVPPQVKVRTALPAGQRTRRHLLRVFRNLRAVIRQQDLVVAGLEGGPTILGYFAARSVGKPIIGWVHTVFERPRGIRRVFPEPVLARHIYPRLSGVVGVSSGVLASLERLTGRQGPAWRVIANPLQAMPPRLARETGAAGPPMVLAAGRLENRLKGFDLLIRAHARLLREGLEQRLVILGEGPDRRELEALVRKEGVTASVELPGFVTEVWAWYDRAAVFVLSSRHEGLPTVILEALARGVPVVATDCEAGPREILDGGAFGELVAVNDVAALAAGLQRVLTDAEYRKRLAREGPRRAAAFAPETIADRWENYFAGLGV